MKVYVLRLTDDELSVVTRPVNGKGGHQSFLRALLARLNDATLEVTADDMDRIYRYAVAYGGGGYQGRFHAMITAARRVGWS